MTIKPIWAVRRLCAKCGKSQPMKGGATSRDGKRFLCADCRPKPPPADVRPAA